MWENQAEAEDSNHKQRERKERMRAKVKMFLVLCIGMLFLHASPAAADGMLEKPIDTNGVWYDNPAGDSNVYWKFTLPGAAYVKCTVQAYSNGGYAGIYNEDRSRRYAHCTFGGSTTAPGTETCGAYLQAGTYYIQECRDYGNWTGHSRIKLTAEYVGNNETEPNNSFDTAMPLPQEQTVTGFLNDDDTMDFYQITLASAQTVDLIVTSKERKDYTVWDQDYLLEKKYEYNSGSDEFEFYLQPGTHYFKVMGYSGSYTVKWRTKQYVSDIKLKKKNITLTKGKTYSLLKSVQPVDANNKTLKWETSNSNAVSVSQDGKIRAKHPGSATITATSTDGSEIRQECLVVVKPERAVIRRCYRVAGLNIRTVVKKQNDVSGYQYQLCRKKNFKGRKSTYNGSSSENIATTDALRRKTTYYFRVRTYVYTNGKTYYGAWSKVKQARTKSRGYLYGYYSWKKV